MVNSPSVDKTEKKRIKAEAKAEKKRAKAPKKLIQSTPELSPVPGKSPVVIQQFPPPPSPAVRFAEAVRGIIYLIFAASLILAVILGQKGVIINLDDIIGHLIWAWAGKIVLVVIALALFIYGLKHLRLVK